jgi:hypothetical protein
LQYKSKEAGWNFRSHLTWNSLSATASRALQEILLIMQQKLFSCIRTIPVPAPPKLNRAMKTLTIAFSLSLICHTCISQVKLPSLIRDSMILQRDSKLPVWGWASPKEKVTVMFNGRSFRTYADLDGNWQIILPPVKAGGPYNMEISGKNKIVLKEILFGDVWFCSGQSNMVHQLNIHDITYAADQAMLDPYPHQPARLQGRSPCSALEIRCWRCSETLLCCCFFLCEKDP